MSNKKVWFITGAGRGMGVDIAKAALAAGYAVVAIGTGQRRGSQRHWGSPSNMLAVKLDVTSRADAAGGGAGRRRQVRPHRRPGQQCRQLLCRLLRGADAGADGAAVGDEPRGSDERHPRRPAGQCASSDPGISSRSLRRRASAGFEFCTAYAASKFGLEGWMESLHAEVAPFGITTTVVNPGFFRTELLTEQSTNYAPASIEDYAERRAAADRVLEGPERHADPATRPNSRERSSRSRVKSPRRAGSSRVPMPLPPRSRRSPTSRHRSTQNVTSRYRLRSTEGVWGFEAIGETWEALRAESPRDRCHRLGHLAPARIEAQMG